MLFSSFTVPSLSLRPLFLLILLLLRLLCQVVLFLSSPLNYLYSYIPSIASNFAVGCYLQYLWCHCIPIFSFLLNRDAQADLIKLNDWNVTLNNMWTAWERCYSSYSCWRDLVMNINYFQIIFLHCFGVTNY